MCRGLFINDYTPPYPPNPLLLSPASLTAFQTSSFSAHLPSAVLRGLSPGWSTTWSPPTLPSPSSVAASSPRPQQQQQQHPSAAADCQRRCPLSRPPATVCAVSGLTLSPSPPPPLRFLLIIKSVSLPSLLCSPPPPPLPLRSNPQLNTVCEMLYCASSGRLSLRIHFCSASVTSTAENNHPLFLTLYLYISYPLPAPPPSISRCWRVSVFFSSASLRQPRTARIVMVRLDHSPQPHSIKTHPW